MTQSLRNEIILIQKASSRCWKKDLRENDDQS